MGMRASGRRAGFALALALVASLASAAADESFRAAGALARSGDYPGAIAAYRELAASGVESASLYWNWAQAAQARGALGEALWALLRARQIDPGDRAIGRAVEQVRAAANLDPAEIAPEPLAALARGARRFRLDLLALLLLSASLGAHLVARLRPFVRGALPAAWGLLGVGLALALVPLLGARVREAAVVVTRGAPLLDSASPGAATLGTLREGEVVPILERGGDYLRVEDSSGSRGWAHVEHVRPLARPPAVTSIP
jgi:hypothetical protein